jgi:hypothetical protein
MGGVAHEVLDTAADQIEPMPDVDKVLLGLYEGLFRVILAT